MAKTVPDRPALDNEQHFHFCIGHSLNWWNRVEDGLGDVFCALLGGVNHQAARNAYLAVIAFNARLQMIDATTGAVPLPSELLAKWKSLRNRADKKSSVRNKLTHFSRMKAQTSKGEWAIFLLPNFWSTEEWSEAMSGRGTRWTWPEIWEFGQQFGQLAAELMTFSREVEAHIQAQPLKYPPSSRSPTE